MPKKEKEKQNAVRDSLRDVKRRNFFSQVLTVGVRVLLFPITLCITVLVWLWSVPFRIYELYVRAKHPFLASDALERYMAGDGDVTFWDLYCSFRASSLSRTDSLFGAYYVRLTERAYKGGKTRGELNYVPEHPSGWYRKEEEGKKNTFYRALLGIVSRLPRIFSFIPSHVSVSLKKAGRAMESSHTAAFGTARFVRRHGALLAPLAVGIVVGVIIGYYVSLPPTFAVRVGDETIGYVESRQELMEALDEVESSVSGVLSAEFRLPEKISYTLSKKIRPDYLSKAELVEALSAYTKNYVRVGYALYVDGRLVAASDTESRLRALLNDAQERAQKNSASEEIELLSEARILPQNCPTDAFLSDEELKALLSSVPEDPASAAKIPLCAYQAATVEVAKKLPAGQAYSYTISYEKETDEDEDLFLVFGGKRIEEEVEPLPFNITYRESDTVYKGAQYIYQKGVAGEKIVSYNVYYSGETEYRREVLSEATAKEPIDQIVLIGTKPLPSMGGSGSSSGLKCFVPPVYGTISSYFGARDMNGDGVVDSNHSGIDIPAPKGTPLYAALGGIVLESGETGNTYGIAVKILHDNGLTTYYAHMDSVTVRPGQTVSQNQMIGTVGTTGFVTGSHVHFEVRLAGGTRVNPTQYLIGY